MKILLTADWHIGVRGDSELYHTIFTNWVNQFLVPVIKSEKINKLYILGDFFDNRSSINIKSENIALWALKEIVAYVDTTIIVGNHDIYFKNTREVNSLKKFEEYVMIINSPKIQHLDNREIFLVPWIIDEKEAEDVFKVKSDICLGHFPFNGFEMVRGVTETKGYSLDKLKNNFLKLFSGHFHLRNGPYVGNPFQMSWSDSEDEKGVTILDTGTLNTKFIHNTISPIYKKIYLSQLKNKTVSLDIIKGNFIKLFLDDKYIDKTLEKLQEVIMSKNPLSFNIEGLQDEEVDINIKVNDLTNPVESLLSWLNNIELKQNINRDILLEKMNDLYKNII